MKTRNLLFGAIGLLLMASCAKNEVVSVNHDGDEIAFNVVTNASTRVDPDQGVFCNNNLPDYFYVWATHDGQTYIQGDRIERYDGANWRDVDGKRYWPETGEVKFFAHSNAGDLFRWNNGVPTIENYVVATSVAEQKDLIYAVKTTSHNVGSVTLNFRHALSQVVFRAQNPNENLHVRISGVSVCKLGNTNTFSYPANDTDDNIVIGHGDRDRPNNTDESSWGQWNELTGGETTYSVNFAPVDVPGGETVSLTDTNEEEKEYSNNAMLLLPQKTAAWKTDIDMAQEMRPHGQIVQNPEEGEGPEMPEANPANQSGTYFLIKCQIWNVLGEEFDETTDVCLWGKDEAKEIAIPVELDLKQGKKYIYTFIFNGGGFNPNPDDPERPTPAFWTITFFTTVDDFEAVQKETEVPGAPELVIAH